MPTETLIAPPESAEDTSFNPSDLKPPDGDQLLKDVSKFIGRYLQCSEHQRTILALWALHTHCLPAAEFTPYLSIQSAEQRSGKSFCLQLLGLLCDHPTLTASFTDNTLTRRLDDKISTVLLDECQVILGTCARFWAWRGGSTVSAPKSRAPWRTLPEIFKRYPDYAAAALL